MLAFRLVRYTAKKVRWGWVKRKWWVMLISKTFICWFLVFQLSIMFSTFGGKSIRFPPINYKLRKIARPRDLRSSICWMNPKACYKSLHPSFNHQNNTEESYFNLLYQVGSVVYSVIPTLYLLVRNNKVDTLRLQVVYYLPTLTALDVVDLNSSSILKVC